jgi:RNA polymerase sigma factor (sigma-70 family)
VETNINQRSLPSPQVVSKGVITAFARGEPDAIRIVYDVCGGLVFGVAYKVLRDRTLAQDATNETFLKAWMAAATFNPDRDLEPWLKTIARNVSIDLKRKEDRRRCESLERTDPCHPALVSLAPSAERIHDIWEVRRAVEALPFDERIQIRLQWFEGLTHLQIAQRLAIPLGTVKSRSNRAQSRLTELLRHSLDETRGSKKASYNDRRREASS